MDIETLMENDGGVSLLKQCLGKSDKAKAMFEAAMKAGITDKADLLIVLSLLMRYVFETGIPDIEDRLQKWKAFSECFQQSMVLFDEWEKAGKPDMRSWKVPEETRQ
jgi:hypothetical protein